MQTHIFCLFLTTLLGFPKRLQMKTKKKCCQILLSPPPILLRQPSKLKTCLSLNRLIFLPLPLPLPHVLADSQPAQRIKLHPFMQVCKLSLQVFIFYFAHLWQIVAFWILHVRFPLQQLRETRKWRARLNPSVTTKGEKPSKIFSISCLSVVWLSLSLPLVLLPPRLLPSVSLHPSRCLRSVSEPAAGIQQEPISAESCSDWISWRNWETASE